MRAIASTLALAIATLGTTSRATRVERTLPNDNRTAAGVRRGNVLTLHLEARLGDWRPNGSGAPGAALPAFAEAGRPPQIPGPLVRVPVGTVVNVTLRNRLSQDTLIVFGLHDRPGPPAPAGVRLAPGEMRVVRFRVGAAGTYYYWGTTTGRDIAFRTGEDAQLTGAMVVDPADAPPPRDRILVIGMWTDTVARAYVPRRRVLGVINGRTWPSTERLVATIGDTVRWRVINASGDNHPMHLHGFYFDVESRGDGRTDTRYRADSVDHVVTESMSPGTTMGITWIPERAGNWLFHCHLPEHFGPRGPLGLPPLRTGERPMTPAESTHSTAHATAHASEAMSGLVVAIEVRPSSGRVVRGTDDHPARRLRLLVRRNAGGSDEAPYYGFALHDLQDGPTAPPPDSGPRLGPPLVLVRGEPVRIAVVNTLPEPTAVHWHGIELESYYDGVPGVSGSGRRLAPLIAANDSFEVRFTPPRAGTFIYHTHVMEERQVPAGLAGPIVVLEPGVRWDPSTDHSVLITSPPSWEEARTSVLLNGSLAPSPLVVRAGVPHRLRVINMTTRRPALRFELRRDTTLVTWRELAKDGADLPESRRTSHTAVRQISVGETVDVELTPGAVGDLVLAVRLSGRLTANPVMNTLPIRVVP